MPDPIIPAQYRRPDEDAPQVTAGADDPDLLSAISEEPHWDPSLRLSPEEEAQIEIDPRPAPAAPLKAPANGSASRSFKGFGGDRGQGSIWDRAHRQYNAEEEQYAQTALADMQATEQGYRSLADASRSHAEVERDRFIEESNLLNRQMGFEREMAELDKMAYEEARAESQQYVQKYEQQLAAVRQMVVTNPMETLPAWQAGGVSLAMFAQGFLAAQGINIDVAGQVDRWIDRSIEEQRRQIGQAEKGAEDTLNLWRIAQDTSRNDLEARQRYKGMILAAMQTATQVNAARFGSQLAMTGANVANQKLALEQLTVARSIRDGYEKDALARKQGMRQETHNRVMEMHQAESNAIARRAAAAKAEKGLSLIKIQDPSQVMRDKDKKVVSGGLNVAVLDPNAPDGIKSKAYDHVVNAQQLYANAADGIGRLRALSQELSTQFGPDWMRNKMSAANEIYNAQASLVIADIQKAMTGLAAPIPEAERYLTQLRPDSVFQLGADRLAQKIDNLQEWARGRFENSLKVPGVIVLPEGHALRTHEAQAGIDPEAAALAAARDAIRAHGEKKPSGIERAAGDAAVARTDRTNAPPSKFYLQNRGELSGPELLRSGSVISRAQDEMAGPSWASDLDNLARAAIDPAGWLDRNYAGSVADVAAKSAGIKSKESDRTSFNPDDVRDKARSALFRVSIGQPLAEGQPVPPKARQDYAAKLLQEMDADSSALLKLLGE